MMEIVKLSFKDIQIPYQILQDSIELNKDMSKYKGETVFFWETEKEELLKVFLHGY